MTALFAKLRTIVVVGILSSTFTLSALPAFSQESEVEAEVLTEEVTVEVEELEEASEELPYEAVSAGNSEVSTLQLQLLLNPLTTDELAVEADAWLLALREQVHSISELELAIEQETSIIDARSELSAQLEKAESSNASQSEVAAMKRQLQQLEVQATATQNEPRFKEIFAEAQLNYEVATGADLVERARKQLNSVARGEERDQASRQIRALETALTSYDRVKAELDRPIFSNAKLEELRQQSKQRKDDVAEAFQMLAGSPLFEPSLRNEDRTQEIRDQLVAQATVLETSRSSLVTRLQLVLDEWQKKGGDIEAYDRYAKTVTGIDFDVTDARGLQVRLMTWLQSEEGGIKFGIGILKLGSVLLVAFIAAPKIGKLSDKLLRNVDSISTLFREFAVVSIERSVLTLGAFAALAAIGIDLAPILAVVGGASFVFAFALQSNLGNFASGLMLLISKPFDVGDEVKVAGYWAFVDSISLANTKLKDFGGNIVTLPNNTVWSGDIINMSHSDVRKLKLNVQVKFRQDIDQVEKIWKEVVLSNPRILKDPGPSIFPYSSTYDVDISIGLASWTKTKDFWSVYAEVLKALQKRLVEEGVELAVPVQEVTLGNATAATNTSPAQLSASVAQAYPVGAASS